MPETVRTLAVHGCVELIRIRAELDGFERLARRIHALAVPEDERVPFEEIPTYDALVLAGRSIDLVKSHVDRFLDLQVAELADPLATLHEQMDEMVEDGELDEDPRLADIRERVAELEADDDVPVL